MKIAINTTPLSSLHAGRGIGQYTSLLLDVLKKYDKKNEYTFFTKELDTSVDVIHYPFFDVFTPSLKLVRGIKSVVTVHDLIPIKYPDKFPAGIRGKIAWWLQKNVLTHVDAIITDSEASAKDITKITKIPSNKIHVIPLAVSPEYKPLTPSEIQKLQLQKYSLPKEFILYVGDINWNKNIPGLLKAFSTLTKQQKYQNLHLVLVGSSFLKKDLTEAQKIENIIQHEKIQDRVLRIGFVSTEELVGIYNLAKLYIQPSFDEGFGLGLLQAMVCGVPTVSSSRGSLPEVGGQDIEYFNPESDKSQIKALETVLDFSPTERRQKVQKSIESASVFTSKKLAEQTMLVYEHIGKTT